MAYEIERVAPEGLPAVAAMLGRAMVLEPMVRWSFDPALEGHELEERVGRYFHLLDEGVVELGFLWQVPDAAGAVSWIPPGQIDAFVRSYEAARPELDALTPDGGRRNAELWGWVDAHVPRGPMWFLEHIGVEPARQGTGIGSALVRFGLERARADGVGAMLETGVERNVGYYERFGFRVTEDLDAPGGGPHVWFMRWDPTG